VRVGWQIGARHGAEAFLDLGSLGQNGLAAGAVVQKHQTREFVVCPMLRIVSSTRERPSLPYYSFQGSKPRRRIRLDRLTPLRVFLPYCPFRKHPARHVCPANAKLALTYVMSFVTLFRLKRKHGILASRLHLETYLDRRDAAVKPKPIAGYHDIQRTRIVPTVVSRLPPAWRSLLTT